MAASFLQALMEKGGYGGGDDALLLPLAVAGLCVLGGMYTQRRCVREVWGRVCVGVGLEGLVLCAVVLVSTEHSDPVLPSHLYSLPSARPPHHTPQHTIPTHLDILRSPLSIVSFSCYTYTATIYSTFFARPTSYPGGPRTQRQERRASWTKRVTTLQAGWVFTHAEESLEATRRHYQSVVGGEVTLTGEAAGRQMWYYDAKEGKALATAGKTKPDYTFSAAVNPNR